MHGGRFYALALALFAVAGLAPPAQAANGLTLGFNPDPVLTGQNGFWVGQARTDGAGIVRLNVSWAQIAPTQRPPGFAASNPASPGYDWSSVDAQVRALTAGGLRVLVNITFAPAWAEAAHMPSNVQPGTWKPSPTEFAQFARAAARRYDGSFPDPRNPTVDLPRVRYWQAWNEPNLDTYLTPQWVRTRHGFAPASPRIYRSMLNAFYAAIKSMGRSNVVVTAGIAPYGNPPGVNFPGGFRVQPLTFDRALFSSPVHFDALAQNSYPIHGPLWRVFDPGDVAVSNVYQVASVLHAAERVGHVLPRGRKQLWMTELGWNSRPPNPGGVPIAEQARWYEQALYVLWRQGVDTVLLLQMVDSPPIPDYTASYQTGLYYLSGQPKPAATAFRFPFVTSRSSRGAVRTWGRAPTAGRLVIERLTGVRWRAIASLDVKWHEVFLKMLALRGRLVLRAQVGGQTSLPWNQGG